MKAGSTGKYLNRPAGAVLGEECDTFKIRGETDRFAVKDGISYHNTSPSPDRKERDGDTGTLKKKYAGEKSIEWDDEHDNFGSLSRADVMITDFSGVIFDYAFIFAKPVIYTDTGLDTAPYDAAWLEEPVWRLKVLPQLGEELQEKDFDSIKELIDKVLADDHYQAGRKSLSEMAWQKKGKAAQNVADYISARKEDKDGAGK